LAGLLSNKIKYLRLGTGLAIYMVWLTKTTKNPAKTAGYGISITYRRTLTRAQNFLPFFKVSEKLYIGLVGNLKIGF